MVGPSDDFSVSTDDTYRHYFHDMLGSTRRLRNENKQALSYYEYIPYGQQYSKWSFGGDTPYRFTGAPLDDDYELYYFAYRYYNPGIARWMTSDPIGQGAGVNTYAYVGGNPVNFTDFLGLHQLVFNGYVVTCYDDNGTIISMWPATSGQERHTGFGETDMGPIPPGIWFFNPNKIHPCNKPGDWGGWRVELGKRKVPDTHGRTELFLHGGLILGSQGCVDIGIMGKVLLPMLKETKGEILLHACYDKGGPPADFNAQRLWYNLLRIPIK
jgi:RHS repeat-associated protein